MLDIRFWYKRHLTYQIIAACLVYVFIFFAPLFSSKLALFGFPGNPAFRNYAYDIADFLYFFDSVGSYFHMDPQFIPSVVSGYPLYTPVFFIVLRFLANSEPFLFIRLIQFVMFCSSVGVIYFSSRILTSLGRSESLSWFFFLPSVLFFTYSRFDMLVVLLVCACVYFFQKEKFILSLSLLAATILFKWFTVFLVPVFFLYTVLLLSKRSFDPFFLGRLKRAWLVFIGIIFFSHIFFLFIFGPASIIEPYLLQMNRPVEIGGFLSVFVGGPIFGSSNDYPGIFSSAVFEQILSFVFLIFQFLPILLFVVSDKRFTRDDFFTFLTWSALIVTSFVLFNKVYSNQWILWFLPFLIFVLKKPVDYVLLVVFDILNYVQFPLIFGPFFQGDVILFQSVAFLRSIILLFLVVRLYWNLRPALPHVKRLFV